MIAKVGKKSRWSTKTWRSSYWLIQLSETNGQQFIPTPKHYPNRTKTLEDFLDFSVFSSCPKRRNVFYFYDQTTLLIDTINFVKKGWNLKCFKSIRTLGKAGGWCTWPVWCRHVETCGPTIIPCGAADKKVAGGLEYTCTGSSGQLMGLAFLEF